MVVSLGLLRDVTDLQTPMQCQVWTIFVNGAIAQVE